MLILVKKHILKFESLLHKNTLHPQKSSQSIQYVANICFVSSMYSHSGISSAGSVGTKKWLIVIKESRCDSIYTGKRSAE